MKYFFSFITYKEDIEFLSNDYQGIYLPSVLAMNAVDSIPFVFYTKPSPDLFSL